MKSAEKATGLPAGCSRYMMSVSRGSEPTGQDATISPLTNGDVSEQLDLILRACGDLQTLMRNRIPITPREVAKLRTAFRLTTEESNTLGCSRSSVCSTSSDESGRRSRSIPGTDTDDSFCNRPEFLEAQGSSQCCGLEAQQAATLGKKRDADSDKEDQQQSLRLLERSTARWDAKVNVCNRALKILEEYARTRPEAQTFDFITPRQVNRKDADGSDFGDEKSDGSTGKNPNKKSNMASEMDGNVNRKRCWLDLLRIPLERRIQTFVISLFLFFTFIPLSCAVTLLLLSNMYTMPFMVAYLVYIYTIGRPRHPLKRNNTFSHLRIFRYYSDYFPVRLVIPRCVRREFDRSKNYFFIYHPHGIHGFGAISQFTLNDTASRLLPGIKIHTQTLKLNFFVPFWRELISLTGSGDASADCIRRTLRSGPGESVLLVVGGAKESLLSKPNTNELTLQRRRGFVRIALQEGTPLVPVYGFGENDVYRIPRMAESEWWKRVEDTLRRYTTFAVPLFVGRGWFNYSFGILPHRRPIVVVVGKPLIVPKIAHPTEEELQMWHDRYVVALQQLFDNHHGVYDVESSSLRIH